MEKCMGKTSIRALKCHIYIGINVKRKKRSRHNIKEKIFIFHGFYSKTIQFFFHSFYLCVLFVLCKFIDVIQNRKSAVQAEINTNNLFSC